MLAFSPRIKESVRRLWKVCVLIEEAKVIKLSLVILVDLMRDVSKQNTTCHQLCLIFI